MTVKLLTPRMGEGVDQVTVIQWLKNEGDVVKELEPLVEVETDKVITEIPSPADGILLKIFVQANITAQVGEALAEIGSPGEAITPSCSRRTRTASYNRIHLSRSGQSG